MEVSATLKEYVESQDRLDRDARAMFPYEFSTCSYQKGALKQQIYACRTCEPVAGESQPGGICYSCSISCHGDHELVELFNRRAFRCDCGTNRLGGTACCLDKVQRPVNKDNRYNDNFRTIFCKCKQLYEHEKESGTMFQCLQCEDWVHDRCIMMEDVLPAEEDFEHFICAACVQQQTWLTRYCDRPDFNVTVQPASDATTPTKDTRPEVIPFKRTSDKIEAEESDNKRQKTLQSSLPKTSTCSWKMSAAPERRVRNLFLVESFRDVLCRCDDCLTRMSDCPALLQDEEVYDPPEDLDDTDSTFDAGTRAMENTLQTLPRDKAIEGILAFQKLKDHITACLRPLAESGEIVTQEHVKSFFDRTR